MEIDKFPEHFRCFAAVQDYRSDGCVFVQEAEHVVGYGILYFFV